MKHELTLIAVDVSKESLEIQTDERSFDVPNTEKGIARLIKAARAAQLPFVVCEATGGYERLLPESMHAVDIPICRANPARIRAFAASEGIQAKTDPIDADVILKFAKSKELRPAAPVSSRRRELIALLDRRDHLKEQGAREKNRIRNSPDFIHASIKRMLNVLKKEITAIEKRIRELIKSDESLSACLSCLTAIKGVGEVSAWMIMAFLGEITMLSRNELVALAGVAPYNRDSGRFKGKRKIKGGRAKVRKALYMATRTAAMYNPVIKAYTDGLQSRGKPYKCAMVAGMRKMLIHMQSELRKAEIKVEL
ncbi:IS110 family transposase [Verrucomicrobia bacterium S94]|nr:IS110 family transposase [Verrucomicrobia bacterium S94]